MNKKLFLILGDQLFQSNKSLVGVDFVMVESRQICERFNYHKQKLTFVLGCMREHRDYLVSCGKTVNYYQLNQSKSFEEVMVDLAKDYDILEFYEISDKGFSAIIVELANRYFVAVNILENPQFLTTKKDFKAYIETKNKRLLMNDFYIWQRKRLNLLLNEDGSPLGGKWNYDEDNRQKLPKNQSIPQVYCPIPTQNYLEARDTVREFYPNNPGQIQELWLPTNHQQAQ